MLTYLMTVYEHIKGVGVFPVNSHECSFCDMCAEYYEWNNGVKVYYCYKHAKESGKEME